MVVGQPGKLVPVLRVVGSSPILVAKGFRFLLDKDLGLFLFCKIPYKKVSYNYSDKYSIKICHTNISYKYATQIYHTNIV